MHVNKDEMCANVRENTRCEGVLFTVVWCVGAVRVVVVCAFLLVLH